MDTPEPRPPAAPSEGVTDEAQLRAWMNLRRELVELHARLEYLRLMMSLGVHRTRG